LFSTISRKRVTAPGDRLASTGNGDESRIDHEVIYIRRPDYIPDDDGVHTLWGIFAGQQSLLENQARKMIQKTLPASLIGLTKQ
jgi:hypothetical protein